MYIHNSRSTMMNLVQCATGGANCPQRPLMNQAESLLVATPVQESRSLPSLVGGALENRHVTGVSCGAAHTVATTEEGIVYAFGWNEYGQVRRRHTAENAEGHSIQTSAPASGPLLSPVSLLLS